MGIRMTVLEIEANTYYVDTDDPAEALEVICDGDAVHVDNVMLGVFSKVRAVGARNNKPEHHAMEWERSEE